MGNLNEVYKMMLAVSGVKQVEAAKMMGLAQETAVGKYLSRGITLGNIYDLAKVLGYEVVIERKGNKTRPSERYVLEVDRDK